MKITTNKFVSVIYDLNVGDGDERELMESATEERPLEFIFGMGSMLPAFEAQLKGLSINESFQFSLSPENAYGEFEEGNVVELPKNVFEVDGKFDAEFIKEGNTVPMMDSDGHRLNGSILDVSDDTVTMNFNHPLAGETLHFSGKIIAVREATAEDLAKLGGSGCNCGCDSDSCLCDCNGDDSCSGGCGCC
jgi:FKBP-type peptidyl-prolyl cis-trans isomerase SlyD